MKFSETVELLGLIEIIFGIIMLVGFIGLRNVIDKLVIEFIGRFIGGFIGGFIGEFIDGSLEDSLLCLLKDSLYLLDFYQMY